MDKQTLDKLKYLINKHKSTEEICSLLDIEINTLYEMVLYLKSLGQNYDILDNTPQKINLSQRKLILPNLPKIEDDFKPSLSLKEENTFKMCLVSDIHYGSLYDRPDLMRKIYEECLKREISHIFCSGDFTNGNYTKRPSFLSQAKIYKASEMIDYVTNIHPKSDYITFYTIAGNHDLSYYYMEGIDICAQIAKLRSDIVYLGPDLADVNLGPVHMRIYHGCDKKRITIEDRLTRFYDKLSDTSKPDILQIGHIHHSLYLPMGGTHIFQTGALINQMPYATSEGLACEKSCWFITIKYDENGLIEKVIPEIKFFDKPRVRK